MPEAGEWTAMWTALGAQRIDPALNAVLRACYSEPHRKYHTLQHLDECFGALQAVRDTAEHPAEVELALWFHDAIYDIERHDNEQRSANWARAAAIAAGVGVDASERVRRLVMTTQHRVFPTLNDEAIVADVDLAILGAAMARFDEYERQVREEYARVPEATYRVQRAALLDALLERPRIYATGHFFATHEVRARDNLARSLRALNSRRSGS